MEVMDAILKRRSIRKFTQEPVKKEDLQDLIRGASMAAYPANLQPLKFAIVTKESERQQLFACTKWAGYLPNGTPGEKERPTAYIVMLGDSTIKANGDFQVETGAAGTTILLAAMEKGLGTCWLGALNREGIRELLSLPEHLVVTDVIALGYPAQHSVPAVMENGDVKYYLDEQGILHVPKRTVQEVIYKKRKAADRKEVVSGGLGMKKCLFPAVVVLYFLVVAYMTKLELKSYELAAILPGLGKVPAEIIHGLLVILALGIGSALIYVFSKKKGGNQE